MKSKVYKVKVLAEKEYTEITTSSGSYRDRIITSINFKLVIDGEDFSKLFDNEEVLEAEIRFSTKGNK